VSVEVIRAAALAGIPHGFLGRRGGVSTGLCAGLNVGLGSGDDREAIAENRRRAVGAVAPGARLVALHQVHSADAVYADTPWPDHARPRADAIVTDRPGLALGILTADCTPVLFADAQTGVIGAAHAGWKGAVAGVLENTVAAMTKLGANPARIVAAIGPTISKANYEVGADLRARFDAADDRFFSVSDRPDHYRFDLPGYARSRLERAGVGRIGDLDLCTYPPGNGFFSYRRTTHLGEADYGREISAIARVAGHSPDR
jgi:purine-nucleoside/S-methyl-5'-thioadenosine phosphorylase / adenosine deaminase